MANVKFLVPFILQWEGGFVNDPDDLGGATMKGITIGTFEEYCKKKGRMKPSVNDLKNISDSDWTDIMKSMYWDRWKADDIKTQAIANILVDWVWASGVHGIKYPQRLLGVKDDGVVGPVTIKALNDYPDQKGLFEKIRQKRREFVNEICFIRTANIKFKKGWLNRINALEW